MKKIIIKLNNPLTPCRETAEERAERLHYSACMRTQVVESKKKYNRKRTKQEDRKQNFDFQAQTVDKKLKLCYNIYVKN